MNITALRPRFIRYLEPLAGLCVRLGLTPNQISVLSLLTGGICCMLFLEREFVAGSVALAASAVLDLVDGSVARQTNTGTKFGAVFDWIADKYVDVLAIVGAGFSGIAILSGVLPVPRAADYAVVALAVFGSMMNTFIKPVVYAEAGFAGREDGKIEDPLEGVGFFGRPETLLVLLLGGLTGWIWLSLVVIALFTNLSALERIWYLSRTLG